MDLETFIRPAVDWAMSVQAELIKAGGVFNAAFAVFHLAFYWLFNWREDLRTLTFVNRAIMRVLNLCLAIVLVMFAYISLVHTQELLSSALGLSLMVSMALFWLVRALQQVIIFRLRRRSSRWFFLAFGLVSLCYGVPAALGVWPGPAAP